MKSSFIPLALMLISSVSPAIELGNTFFQTNEAFNPMIGLDVDFLVVHRHGAPNVGAIMRTWKNAGYPTGRMFFIGSDADRIYTTGKWDGKQHLDETEVDRNGNPIECAGVRPYMIPTEGWKAFVRGQIKLGIDGEAVCILPEEPLAHVTGGYGEAFKRIYKERYGTDWVAPHSSTNAYYKSSKLLCDLYFELVEDTLQYTKEYAAEKGREVKYLLPIHPLLSHANGLMTYASGRSLGLAEKGFDGFVGQVWTGPIAWGMSKAEGKPMDRNNDFFESAYLMYSYFAYLVKGTSVPCYMLADPVEDDPQYSWEDYRKWYNQCLVAMLQFPWMGDFEVMPWPDRVFLPGYTMATGTPGPEDYRRALMTAFAVLQEIGDIPPADPPINDEVADIGFLVMDSLSWQRGGPQGSRMESVHGFTVPLLRHGIPIPVVPIERFYINPQTLGELKTLVLSYDAQKPQRREGGSTPLAEWVKAGGTLIYLGGTDAYNSVDEWWREEGYDTPQQELWERLGIWKKGDANPVANTAIDVDQGRFLWYNKSAASLADDTNGGQIVMDLLAQVSADGKPLTQPEYFSCRRGDFLAARACGNNYSTEGTFLDLLDPNLPVVMNPVLAPKQVGLFLDLHADQERQGTQRLLFAGPRAKSVISTETLTQIELRSPDNTPATLRLACLGAKAASVTAKAKDSGAVIEVRQEYDAVSDTLLCIIPAGVRGAVLEVKWEKESSCDLFQHERDH